MRRDEYLCQKSVRDFVEWLRPVVRATGQESLWNAYNSYEWKKRSFDANQIDLDLFQKKLRQAAEMSDEQNFVSVAKEVQEWGGLSSPQSNWPNLHQFVEASRLLDPATADTDNLKDVPYYNATWSKLYSLMLDGFVMYDSRVSAAMVWLVECHCQQTHLSPVPEPLGFVRTPPRGKTNRHVSGTSTQRAKSNLWAAWVLDEVCHEGKFGELSTRIKLRALEAALFMIGKSLRE